MAHAQQRLFLAQMQNKFPRYFINPDMKILEIGSRNVNGTCRDLFNSQNYIGLDLSEGPGVDIICHAKDYVCPAGSFDVVVSCEALEHDSAWQETLMAAYRLLAPGGILIITCAGPARAEHGTRRTTPKDSPATLDHYKNISPSELLDAYSSIAFMQSEAIEGWGGKDTYFYGVK